jgi:hypothetical protein
VIYLNKLSISKIIYHECECGGVGGMIWVGKSQLIGEKPVPLSLCTVSAREFTTVT